MGSRKNTVDPRAVQQGVEALRNQIEKGLIQKGYQALLHYMMDLRTHYAKKSGVSAVSNLYQGYMDMTCFTLSPPALKRHNLKVAIVFNYEEFRFEAWLAARNRKTQRNCWELFKDHPWAGCRVVAPAEGIDSILECDLAVEFDLSEPSALTSTIEKTTTVFIENIERFLAGSRKGAL